MTTDTQPLAPTDAEIDAFVAAYLGDCGPQATRVYSFTRAVLAKWGAQTTKVQAIQGVQWQCGPQANGFTAPQATTQSAPSHTAMQLAELVLSDCGHSSNYTPLLDRVAARIDSHVERRLDELRGCLESKPAPQPSSAAQGDALDAAFEAVRKNLCALQRYSFCLDDDGVVRRAQDRTGNWIEFDDAHKLFDPVAVDAARKQGANHD